MTFFKHLLSVLLFVFIFSVSFVGLVKADYSRCVVYFDPLSIETLQEGQTFSLVAMVDPGDKEVGAVQAYIDFDPDKVSLLSITPNSPMWNTLTAGTFDNLTGEASIVLGMPPGGTYVTEATEMFTLSFETLSSSRGASVVSFNENTKVAAIGFSGDVISYRQDAKLYFSLSNNGFAYFSWDPVSPEPEGYKLYYGLFEREGEDPNTCGMCGYENVMDVGDATSVNFNDLLGGRSYYFSMTSYNASGVESSFNQESEINIPLISADLNGDGTVNATDFAILMSGWGSTGRPNADINRDNYVNATDFAIMMSQWMG